jgi:hypothetical protein
LKNRKITKDQAKKSIKTAQGTKAFVRFVSLQFLKAKSTGFGSIASHTSNKAAFESYRSQVLRKSALSRLETYRNEISAVKKTQLFQLLIEFKKERANKLKESQRRSTINFFLEKISKPPQKS